VFEDVGIFIEERFKAYTVYLLMTAAAKGDDVPGIVTASGSFRLYVMGI